MSAVATKNDFIVMCMLALAEILQMIFDASPNGYYHAADRQTSPTFCGRLRPFS
jgi:hypothetical protein